MISRLLAVPVDEFHRRRRQVVRIMEARFCDSFVGFGVASARYLTGWLPLEGERPVAVIIDRDARATLFVPLLKEEDARTASADNVVTNSAFRMRSESAFFRSSSSPSLANTSFGSRPASSWSSSSFSIAR